MNQSIVNLKWKLCQIVKLHDNPSSIIFQQGEESIIVVCTTSMIALYPNTNGNWDLSDQILQSPPDQIFLSVIFSPDRRYFASANLSHLSCWAQSNNEWINFQKLYCSACYAFTCVFNHDSTVLAWPFTKYCIQIHQIIGNKWVVTQTLSRHNNTIQCMQFNDNSSILATSDVKCIILWKQVRRNEWIFDQVLNGNKMPISCMSFNKQSTLLVAVYSNSDKIIWCRTQKNRWKCVNILKAIDNQFFLAFKVIFSHKYDLIISGDVSGRLCIWRYSSYGMVEQILQCDQLIDFIINDESNLLVLLSRDENIMFYSLQVNE